MNCIGCENNATGKREHPLSLLLDMIMALCGAFALVLDMNMRSGNNYYNWSESLPASPVIAVLFAALLYVRWTTKKDAHIWWGIRGCLLSLFLGAWYVLVLSVRTTHDLNQPFLSHGQMLKAMVIMVGMAGLYELVFRLLDNALRGRVEWRAETVRSSRVAELYRKHTVLFCMALLLMMWLPQMICGYPCTMNADTAAQVRQAIGLEERVANHPPFGTMLLEVSIYIGGKLGSYALGLYLYALVQCLFGAAVLGYSQKIMRKLEAPRWLRAGSLLICGVMPIYCDYVMVLIKDIPYVYAVVLLLCEMTRAEYLREENYALSAGYMIRVALAGVIMMNIRNNGLMILLPTMLVMLWRVLRRKNRKAILRAVIVASIPFILTACIEQTLNHANEIQPRSPREGLSLPFQQTARFVREHGDSIPQEEREAIDAVLLYDRIGDFYNPMLSDPVKATYKENASVQDLMRYFAVWAKQFFRDPLCYVKATLIQNSLLFDPHPQSIVIFRNTGLYGEAAERLNISRPAALCKVEKMESYLYEILFTIPFVMELNSMGFYCILLMGICLFVKHYHIKDMGIILLPALVTLAMLVLGPCLEYQDRYAFPIVYCMPLMLACVSYGLKNKERKPCAVKI